MTSPPIWKIHKVSALTARLHRVLRLHFDPDQGTPYWLDRAASLAFNPATEVRELTDLYLLGDMTPKDLTDRPLLDYIPRKFHSDLSNFIIGQTGGTTGQTAWTAYRKDEFAEAFITPFTTAARHVGFPESQAWLYVGPTGPHIIGKVVCHLAHSLNSPEPFNVDFDPRWAKKLPPGSLAQQRYLEHIALQALHIINNQNIRIIFTTPAVLKRLAETMTTTQRLQIRGIHYGGMPLAPADLHTFQTTTFPNAIHLSGYGNTLFGCCLELGVQPNRQLEYFPYGSRLHFETIDETGQPLPDDSPGRLRFTRLDESHLIVRMLERDQAELLPPPANAPADYHTAGLRNPHSPPTATSSQTVGLY